LNILCTSLVKHYDTKNNHLPFALIHSVTATSTYPFFNLPDIIEAWSDLYIKTFSSFSRVRMSLWILSKSDILCTNAMKRHYA